MHTANYIDLSSLWKAMLEMTYTGFSHCLLGMPLVFFVFFMLRQSLGISPPLNCDFASMPMTMLATLVLQEVCSQEDRQVKPTIDLMHKGIIFPETSS